MRSTSNIEMNREIARRLGSVTRSQPLSPEVRVALRSLGSLALNLAEGQIPDTEWLLRQSALSTDGATGLLTVPEACARLRISKSNLYTLIHHRELSTVKIGRRRFVPVEETTRFVQQLTRVRGRA
ncbi:helix-turn-helix domain-containing protein [Nocardia brasiliensis]